MVMQGQEHIQHIQQVDLLHGQLIIVLLDLGHVLIILLPQEQHLMDYGKLVLNLDQMELVVMGFVKHFIQLKEIQVYHPVQVIIQMEQGVVGIIVGKLTLWKQNGNLQDHNRTVLLVEILVGQPPLIAYKWVIGQMWAVYLHLIL